jgi:heme-degrading monooxygenase HmoA
MAVGMLIEVQGGTQEQYDKTMVELNMAANPAPGLISHVAGPSETGWRVVDVWESKADFDNFLHTRLGAAIQKGGFTGQPTMSEFVIHNSIRT